MNNWIKLLAMLLFSAGVMAESEKPVASGNSDLDKNLEQLEAYYRSIDEQLNQRMRNGARDPFAEQMQQAPIVPSTISNKPPAFVPQAGIKTPANADGSGGGFRSFRAVLPKMNFQGFIASGKKRSALLNIDGIGTLVVAEGDTIGLQPISSDVVIKVVEINSLNLIVETGVLGGKGEKMVVQ